MNSEKSELGFKMFYNKFVLCQKKLESYEDSKQSNQLCHFPQ